MRSIVCLAFLPACATAAAIDNTDAALAPDGPPIERVAKYGNLAALGVSIVAAGRGCADRFCLWIEGFNLSTSTQVVVRDHLWNAFHTYAGAELVYALADSPQHVTLRLASTAEQNELALYGLILTIADHGTWDNIGVAP